MATRDTTSLPNNNVFKSANNAEQALDLLAKLLHRLANVAQAIAGEDIAEAVCEGILTVGSDRLDKIASDLNTWQAL